MSFRIGWNKSQVRNADVYEKVSSIYFSVIERIIVCSAIFFGYRQTDSYLLLGLSLITLFMISSPILARLDAIVLLAKDVDGHYKSSLLTPKRYYYIVYAALYFILTTGAGLGVNFIVMEIVKASSDTCEINNITTNSK